MQIVSDTRKRERPDDDSSKEACDKPSHKERLVIPQEEADGSIRYIVTEALLRRAAKAASRKNFEAA